MIRTYKIFFTNGSDITISAHHSKCQHISNVNRDIVNYCDENDAIIATFQMDKIIGDVLVKIQEDDEEKETKEVINKNKRVKVVGFQLPEEDNNEEVKEKSKKSKPKSSTKLDGQQKKSKKR